MKKWLIGKPSPSDVKEIASAAAVSPFTAEALCSLGVTSAADAESFFGISPYTDELGLFSPFDIPDMQKAADIISKAVDSGEKIFIYGDYDCDGILSTAALYNYLYEMGADVDYFINERSDGYGMNINNVRKLAERGAQLIVTVDNGISAAAECELCAELGIKLVITDHHTPPPVLPKADAVVDPHIDSADNHTHFRDLCGCGVVLKLITAMEGGSNIPVETMSDFAAIAAIGDVMPLRGENRTIVRHGLHYMKNTENLGLKALIKAAVTNVDGRERKFSYDARTVAFTIVPRINASGRMGSAMDAAELFTTDDPQRAEELAQLLCSLNRQRKDTEKGILKEAADFLAENPAYGNSKVVTVFGRDWHPGVIGIAAAKISEQTGKPTFIISVNDKGEGVGSARAQKGFSVYKSLLENADILTKFGGHEGAGGFSLPEKNINELHRRLNAFAGEEFFEPEIIAVKALSPKEVTVESAELLAEELMPYGEKNPEPVYLLPKCRIINAEPLTGGKYTKVTADFGGKNIEFPLFNMPYSLFHYMAGDELNIMASLRANEYKGMKCLSICVIDMRLNGINQQKLLGGERIYKRMKCGSFPEDERILKCMLPSRREFAAAYRAIPERGEVPEEYIFNRLCGKMNSCMINIILDCFAEKGLITRNAVTGTVCRLKTEKGSKADLSSAEIIRSIQERIINN